MSVQSEISVFFLLPIFYFTWHPTSDQGSDEVDSDEDHSGHDRGDRSGEVRDGIHGVRARGRGRDRAHGVRGGKRARGDHSGVARGGRHDERVDSDGRSGVVHSGDRDVHGDRSDGHGGEGSDGRGAL